MTLWALVSTIIGWILGVIFVWWFTGANRGFVTAGAFFGGFIGLAVGGLFGFRRNFYDAEWDKLTAALPWSFWFIFGGLAAKNGLPPILIAFVAAIGAGCGALLARYCLHFFDPDPPQTLF